MTSLYIFNFWKMFSSFNPFNICNFLTVVFLQIGTYTSTSQHIKCFGKAPLSFYTVSVYDIIAPYWVKIIISHDGCCRCGWLRGTKLATRLRFSINQGTGSGGITALSAEGSCNLLWTPKETPWYWYKAVHVLCKIMLSFQICQMFVQ